MTTETFILFSEVLLAPGTEPDMQALNKYLLSKYEWKKYQIDSIYNYLA